MTNILKKLQAAMEESDVAVRKDASEIVKKTLCCIVGNGSADWTELAYTGVICLEMMANSDIPMIDRDLFAKMYFNITAYCNEHLKKEELESFDALTSAAMSEKSVGLREFMANNPKRTGGQ